MAFQCSCGSHRFKPLGIMEGMSGRGDKARPRVLFLVNCLECGTTVSCNSLDFFLLRSEELVSTLDEDFFAAEEPSAV